MIGPGRPHPATGRIELLRIKPGKDAALVPHPRRVEEKERLHRDRARSLRRDPPIANLRTEPDATVTRQRARIIAAPDCIIARAHLFIR